MIGSIITFSQTVYWGQEEILRSQEILVDFVRASYEPEHQEMSTEEVEALDKRVLGMLRSNDQLTPIEKNFMYTFLNLVILFVSIEVKLTLAIRQANRLNFDQLFRDREYSMQDGAAHLANYLEMWRSRLVTEVDKVIAWGEGGSFFQKATSFFYKDLNRTVDAYNAVETARGRAFADFLHSRFATFDKSKFQHFCNT